jgi:hypothetical protein
MSGAASFNRRDTMEAQRTWTLEELKQRLQSGESVTPSDRVWDGCTNLSVRSYLKIDAILLRRERKISFAEALRVLCNQPA